MNLILFSASYPFVSGGEQNFLEIEMEHLLKSFNRVVVVPENCKGANLNSYAELQVDTSYSKMLVSRGIFRIFLLGLFSPLFYRGLMEKPSLIFSFAGLRRLFSFAGMAELTRQWVLNWLKNQNLDGHDCVFYTYWFAHAAAGIGRAKQKFPHLNLVSRAHGYDIYEEQYYDPPYWPCRESVLNTMDKVFPDSKAGAEYLQKRYVEYSPLFEVSLLGVRDPGFVTSQSEDGVFRIVSCSRISPEKRVDHLLKAIAFAAQQRPSQYFEWYHFGNGETREYLQKVANETFPPNAKGCLPGYSDNKTLMSFYKNNPIDVFVNVSRTEGIPVAIMEAISCGIPVIATKVGGNSEVVSEQSGLLLDPNPSPVEAASAFFYFIDHPEDAKNKRVESRIKWLTQFNADHNFKEFADRLIAIRKNL